MSDVDEVRALARAYEAALVAGDTDAASALFDDDAATSRFGPEGAQLSLDDVRALRAATAPTPEPTWLAERVRQLAPGVVLHLAVLERGDRTIHRTQVWVRRSDAGWRIAHAHVSRGATDG